MMQILSGGAPCQQIDSEEDDDQEAEAEDEVSCSHTINDIQAVGSPKDNPCKLPRCTCGSVLQCACVVMCTYHCLPIVKAVVEAA